MSQGIEARCKYGGLRLSCDPEALERLRSLVCSDPVVVEAIGDLAPGAAFQFVTIGPPVPEASGPRLGWLQLLGLLVAWGFGGTAQVVGIVVVFRWLFRLWD